jgi:LacI family transcriptional regulator
MKKVPRLVDVARRAKVNISTVSRIINNKNRISLETQEKVRKVMRELGYRPSRVARRLRARSGQRNLLGLIIPNIQNPFFADLARGVEDVAYRNNYAVLLCNYDENQEKQQFYLDVMQAESVDGIILPPLHEEDAAFVKLVQNGIPLVCVDRSVTNVAVDEVTIDNQRGAFEAIQYLIQKGHRRIGLITGPVDTSTGRQRLRGYESAHATAGYTVETELIRYGDFKQDSGHRLAIELLSLPHPPTALFVCNNLMTIGALEAIFERRQSIPGQVAIIGFDDLPLASVFNPPLTVVRQPAYEVGKAAAELLLRRFEDPRKPVESIKFSPELIIRQSC